MAIEATKQNDGSNVNVRIIGERISFPSLFKKDKYDRYSVSVILAPGKYALPLVIEALADPAKAKKAEEVLASEAASGNNYAKVVLAIISVARAKWGKAWLQTLKVLIAKDDICLRSGDLKPDLAGYPGNFILSTTNTSRPLLLDRAKQDIDESSGLLYSGSRPILSVDIWAQDNPAKGWKRINAQVLGVQHYRDDERFAGGRTASRDEFEEIADPDGDAGGDDLIGGDADDDIPF